MSKWLICGVLSALPLWGGDVALYTEFQHQPPSAVLQALQQEVETLMAPMGAEFDWRSLDNVTGSQVSPQLAVIKFLGRCEPGGLSTPSAGMALGWTHMSDGVILPFSDIDCDGIRNFLQMGLRRVAAKMRDEAYGRALGRVLAHELYHIFANTVHHGSNGAGKSCYSVDDLLAPDFHFEERESQALQISKTRVGPDTTDASR